MRVIRNRANQVEHFLLVDDDGKSLPNVDQFVLGLQARGCSPNTIISYLYDLKRFYEFLESAELRVEQFVAAHTVDFFVFLNAIKPSLSFLVMADVGNFIVRKQQVGLQFLYALKVIKNSVGYTETGVQYVSNLLKLKSF